MRVVGAATLSSTSSHHVKFSIEGGHTLRVIALEEDMIRVCLDRDGARSVASSWMVAPAGIAAAPYDGRPKESTDGFALPNLTIQQAETAVTVATSRLRVIVPLGVTPLALRWEWKDVASGGEWRPLLEDRKSGAYYFGRHDERASHYMRRRRGDKFFGLGEKTGTLDKAGGRYRMDCNDALGYDAERSDPLYKFWPFYIAKPADVDAAYGVFYDNPAACAFDLGCTHDNYHGYFSGYEARCGDLDYTVILGPKVLQVTRRFAWLIGGTAWPPMWSLGYSGSTMSYTDSPNAQERMGEFLALCAKHDIPCSSFQLSSGYTSIAGKRYVFNWNDDKFPDPKAFARQYRDAGVRLAANIKPCLLTDHPQYAKCASAGLFLRDSAGGRAANGGGASGAPGDALGGIAGSASSGADLDALGYVTPESAMFWDAVGSHLDFTNPRTAEWWRAQVTEKLLDVGITCTWNDNNEWHVDDEAALCCGFGRPTPLKLLRPVQTLLMVRCSHAAQTAHDPATRPWLITRSGLPGVQRYAQTWTGDNYTSWHTLKWNVPMGLGLSLSGFYNVGHDVGGFAGPPPEPELLVRWVQNGCFHPRFTIHSWNDDQTANEPWMYGDSITPLVRAAIKFRYSLMPYLYHVLRKAVDEHEPLLRPTFLDHEHDPKAWEASDDFMLGRALLVASVVHKGQRERDVYLPDNHGAGWWDWHTGAWHAGGQTITLPAPLERCPLLARGGSLVVRAAPSVDAADMAKPQARTLHLFPTPPGAAASSTSLTWVEDDGVSVDDAAGRLVIACDLQSSPTLLTLTVRATFYGSWRPAFTHVDVVAPAGDERRVRIEGEYLVQQGDKWQTFDCTATGPLLRFATESRHVGLL